MIVIAKLEKPYKDSERINFIVNYNHQLGYEIRETNTGLEALGFDDDERKEQKAVEVRAIRNQYLEKYVDPKQLVLVWNGLTEDEQKEYMDYRQYLLDYPETEDWYEQSPMTFEEWKESTKTSEKLEQIIDSGD